MKKKAHNKTETRKKELSRVGRWATFHKTIFQIMLERPKLLKGWRFWEIYIIYTYVSSSSKIGNETPHTQKYYHNSKTFPKADAAK